MGDMKVYVYQEKKKIAVALVQMYEYSIEFAAEYVGVEKRQVMKWLYENHSAIPDSPLIPQKRVERDGLLYPTTKEEKHYGNIVQIVK